jgi:hypothetical protein
MTTSDFTTTFVFDQSPATIFNAINNIKGWWSEDSEGASEKLHDEFTVRFNDVHVSSQKLTALVPEQKVEWLVTTSNLNFLKDKQEWDGTRVTFELEPKGNQTQLRFIHHGLVPEIECFNDCSKGWTFYLNSLHSLITTGQGQPHKK